MKERISSLTIDNILESDVGRVLEVLREAGWQIEINISRPEGDDS